MRLSNAVAFVAIALAGAAGAAASYKAPVAVLPFKNLNDDPATNWLKLGIAETMLTDLKKAKVNVVERDQIDKALGEILLQGDGGGTEDGQAVQVGKLVGAKTVVVGSFQAAGKQLRFNARFVEVETGVILDSAKATGPIDQVFSLQDQVVDKLLGADAAKAARPARSRGVKTVEAYKLYAMSLATASDAERVGLLKKSLSLDPSFVYATEELAALEKRLAEYARSRATAGRKLDEIALVTLRDPAIPPEEKAWRSAQYLNRILNDRRCRHAIAEAEKIVEMNIPDPKESVTGATEFAYYTLYDCHRRLNDKDLALQAGERLLQRYPAGTWYLSVETGMKDIVAWKRAAPERRAKVDARMKELDAEQAEVVATMAELESKIADARKAAPPEREVDRVRAENTIEILERRLKTAESRLFSFSWERCWFPANLDAERTAEGCRAFREAYRETDKSWEKPTVLQAEVLEIKALAELARWSEAMQMAKKFLAENTGTEDYVKSAVRDIQAMMNAHWPADAAP